MMKVNPLHFLLFIEGSLLIAGGLIFAIIRYRRIKALHQKTLKELVGAKHAEEELRTKLAAAKSSAAAAPEGARAEEAGGQKELDELREKLRAVEAELGTKSKKMEQLQLKFSDLEKEYMVLYQQQQGQQEQPKIP